MSLRLRTHGLLVPNSFEPSEIALESEIRGLRQGKSAICWIERMSSPHITLSDFSYRSKKNQQ